MQIDADLSAVAKLDSPGLVAACDGSTLLHEYSAYVRAQAERALGHLRRCIGLVGPLVHSRSGVTLGVCLNVLSGAALLAGDESALAEALESSANRLGPTSPVWRIAQHRIALLRGAPSVVDPDLPENSNNFSPAGLHILVKEAIDAGDTETALTAAHSQAERGPYSQAVLAACLATTSNDENRWHDALQIAAAHNLLLFVVDAIEGLAVSAVRSSSWAEALRLFGAGLRLRDECEYRWRFSFEQTAIEKAVSEARLGLGAVEADQAQAEGRALTWREAVSYASRARGERRRPRHGWDALTPTEQQVVRLVTEGLTNPQIGTQLLMSRATVKTHLEHIFAKLGIHSRAELASRAARHDRG